MYTLGVTFGWLYIQHFTQISFFPSSQNMLHFRTYWHIYFSLSDQSYNSLTKWDAFLFNAIRCKHINEWIM